MLEKVTPVDIRFEDVAKTVIQHAHKSAKEHPLIQRFFLFITATTIFFLVAGTAAGLGIVVCQSWNDFFSPRLMNYASLLVVCRGLGLCLGYLSYGFSLLILCPIAVRLFGLQLSPSDIKVSKKNVIIWYLHNSVHYLVRYTFLEWTLLSPVVAFYLRLMGARVGDNVLINSSAISDVCLMTFEDHVVIGGGAKVMGHYSDSEVLVFAPVIFKRGSAVGCNSVILGGVIIGEGAKVLPNSYVKPNTIIPAGEVWGGVPAKRLVDRSDCI